MIILIEGFSGSGYSVLRGLLDGHPNIFCSPVHDYIPVGFLDDWADPIWFDFKCTEHLRRILSKSGYWRIEKYSNNKRIPMDYGKGQRGYVKMNFDFYKFDKGWMKKVLKLRKWAPEAICETIYKTMMEEMKNDYHASTKKVKHYVALTQPPVRDPTKLLEKFPNAKLLYTRREPEGLVASHVTRKPLPEEFTTLYRTKTNASQSIAEGMVERIMEKHKLFDEFAKRMPKRVKVVHFAEAVENTVETMKSVAGFLGIPFTEELTYFSMLGKERLTGKGQKYVGKILDRPEDLLSKKDLAAIRKRKENFCLPFIKRKLKRLLKLLKQ